MGFFDKIKEFFKQIKEDNKYFARTTARINNGNLYGWVNYRTGKIDPNEDFRLGSYINIEDGKGLIYSTGTEDYVFEAGDIVLFNYVGQGHPLNGANNTKIPTMKFEVEFKDGKKTTMDIDVDRLNAFKAAFEL